MQSEIDLKKVKYFKYGVSIALFILTLLLSELRLDVSNERHIAQYAAYGIVFFSSVLLVVSSVSKGSLLFACFKGFFSTLLSLVLFSLIYEVIYSSSANELFLMGKITPVVLGISIFIGSILVSLIFRK